MTDRAIDARIAWPGAYHALRRRQKEGGPESRSINPSRGVFRDRRDVRTTAHALTLFFTNRADPLNSIESRINRMEALLQSSGIVINPPPVDAKTSPSEFIEGQTTLSITDGLSNLIISDAGEQKYIGMADTQRALGAIYVV